MIFTDERVGIVCVDWFSVFMLISEALKDEPDQKDAIRIELQLKPFGMLNGSRQGWQAELWLQGKWKTPEAAHDLWSANMEYIIPIILEAAKKVNSNRVA